MTAEARAEQHAHDETGAIMAILEPWCHVGSYSQPFYGLRAKSRSYGPYSFDVTV